MKQSIWTVNQPSNPQAFITKRKQRIKQFEGQVYLNDGDEYEIEIFNPTPTHILAKIKIDNEYLSGGGIVLRPGERIFLERFLDSNNKFVFRTYEVGKEAVNAGALANNGYVKIEFYQEQPKLNSYPSYPNRTIYNDGIFRGNVGLGYGGTTYTTNTLGNSTFTTSGTNLTTSTAYLNNVTPTSMVSSNKVETGLTEKGGSSNQTFTQSNKEFYSYSFHNVAWRILPTSNKQYHKEDLGVLYCGECGAKRKKDTHKFCPHCGTKF
jgi:hypothetical protein